jgi:hypothetical protein
LHFLLFQFHFFSSLARTIRHIRMSGAPMGISAGVVGAIIGSVLLVCLTLAFCYYGVVCKRMGNDSFRMQVAGRDARMISL